jgi:putative radical SAM enzyme (TIGR03279 family)
VDQLPPGLRETLYFKDDDARLSFLLGNYITMTNLSEREIQRVIDLRISPLHISVHATNGAIRAKLLGNRRGGEGLARLRRFAEAGIRLHGQIVACPGENDGSILDESMADLFALAPALESVSIVPVGLTKFREGLYPLRPYTREEAQAVIGQVETFAARCLTESGSRRFWCSDEFYLKGALPLPEDAYYEEYPQLENGVGMLRLLETEFLAAARLEGDLSDVTPPPVSWAPGVAAAPFLRKMIDTAAANCHTKSGCTVYAVKNRFFGESIDVAGLVTGGDLMEQLRGKNLGTRLLLPQTMLRHGETVFLDDVTIKRVEAELGVTVTMVPQDGGSLFDEVFSLQNAQG